MINSWNRTVLAAALTFVVFSVPCASLSQTTDPVRNLIHSKSGLVSGLAAKLEASEKQVNALKLELQAKEQSLATLNASLQQVQTQLSQIAAQDAGKGQRLAEAEAALQTLKSDLAAREEELKAMAENEKALAALQAQFDAQKSLVDGLNSRLQEQDGLIVDLQSRLGRGREDPEPDSGMTKDQTESRSSDSDLKADLDAAIYTVRERDAEIGRLQSDLQTAKSAIHESRKGIESLEFQRLLLGGGLALAVIGLFMSFRRRR